MLTKAKIGFLVFAAFLVGVAGASYLSVSIFVIFLLFLLGGGGLMLGAFRSRALLVSGFVILALVLGFWRMEAKERPHEELQVLMGTSQEFRALILESPEVRGSSARIVVSARLLVDDSAKLLLLTRRFPEFRRGETVVVSGALDSLSEEERIIYQRRGIEAMVRFPEIQKVEPQPFSLLFQLDRVRRSFREAIQAALPEPDAGFVLGILTGERSAISPELREMFNRTSTSHLIALSGFNITIIAIFVGWVLGGLHLSPRAKLITAGILIGLFCLLVEGGASVVRAAVMGVLALVARERGRIYEMTNALVFAGAVMVFLNPYLLRFDLSFQLSFLATLGIILVPPLITRYFLWLPESFKIREAVVMAISAELFVVPLILWHFGAVSLIGPFANVLVVPVIPATMLLGFVTGILGIMGEVLGIAGGWATHLVVLYELSAIRALSEIPGAAASLPAAFSWILVVPALLLTLRYLYRRFSTA